MSRDTPVDWTQLTDPEQALRWSLRGEDDYDSYQKDNQFVARVIFADDEHSKVSASELLAVFGTMVSSDSAAEVRKFRGRIIGKNSPHSFLPDPCNPDFQGAEFEELTKNLINLHTLFYVMNADGATPNVDSYWLVTLNASGCPGAPFNLQFAQAIEVISETEKQVAAAEKACEALEKLDWEEGSPLGSHESAGRRASAKGGHGKSYEDYLDDSVCDEGYEKFWMIHPLQSPVYISSDFNEMRGDARHSAVDFVAEEGTPIYAPADGTVSVSGADLRCGHKCMGGPGCKKSTCADHESGGNIVTVDHGTVNGKKYKSKSMHLQEYAGKAKDMKFRQAGKSVKRGDIIGYVGMTGNTTGGHDHFQFYVNGSLADPMPYIKRIEKCPSPEKLAAIENYHRGQEERCTQNDGTWIREEKKCDTGEADV